MIDEEITITDYTEYNLWKLQSEWIIQSSGSNKIFHSSHLVWEMSSTIASDVASVIRNYNLTRRSLFWQVGANVNHLYRYSIKGWNENNRKNLLTVYEKLLQINYYLPFSLIMILLICYYERRGKLFISVFHFMNRIYIKKLT